VDTLRDKVRSVHRWTGLTAGLLLVFIAITGASMAFRPVPEPIVDRDLHDVPGCTERLAIDDLAARAKAAYPAKRVLQVEMSEGGPAATIVRCADMQGISIDPCPGSWASEIVGVASAAACVAGAP
jgi:vanillate O-demethylase ferredoxin subunit